MPKNRDRTKGLPYPVPVDPGEYIYMCLPVPNNTLYRQALYGVLSELGKPWTWQQTTGTDNEGAYQAAEVWRRAVSLAVYTDDCGAIMPIDCDDIANCIETSTNVKNAIQSVVPYTPIDGYTFPPGAPLTPSQMTMRLNEIDECAFDPYWAQVEQYVDFMVNLGQDVLDQIAAYSAALDAGENVPMGQFLGKLKNSSTAGKVVDFLQWVLTVVKAAYEAADNTANRDAIKCAIFCANRDACLITIQGTLDVLNERLGGLLVPSDLNDLPSMVDAFMAATFNPSLALDLWITFLMGSAKTAGMFGLEGIDETLQMVLAAAVNDANNDWVIKCEDCGDETPNIAFVGTFGTSYDGNPRTFVENTPTGGSVWDLTFQDIGGTIAVAVTAKNAANVSICVRITSTTNVVSYQHNLCAGGAQSGTTENPLTEYGPDLGWFGASGGTVMRVTAEPV